MKSATRPLRFSTRLIAVLLLGVLAAVMPSSNAGAIDGNMDYHGGEVMGSVTTYAVFWLPAGTHFEGDATGDARYEGLIEQYLRDVGGTPYYDVLTQYSRDANGNPVKNGPIQNASTFGGAFVDTTPFPHAGTDADPLRFTDARAAIERAMQANGWPAGLDRLFFLYTPQAVVCEVPFLTIPDNCHYDQGSRCLPRGGWSLGGRPVLLGIITNLDALGSPSDCNDLGDASRSPNHDPLADNAVIVTAFHQAELVTDPLQSAWYQNSPENGEVADTPCLGSNAVHALHGHSYVLPGLWSNAQGGCVFAYPPLPARLSLAHKTIGPHQEETLRLTSAPHAHVAINVIYYDRSFKNFRGDANSAGVFQKRWKVPGVRGPADVEVQITTDDGNLARAHSSFRIH